MQGAVRTLQSFDGEYIPRAHTVRQCRARIVGYPVDRYRAGATLAAIAADLGAGQAELVAQGVRKRLLR